MNTLTFNTRNLLAFGIPLFLMLSIIVFSNSSLFQLHPRELSIGITFDLIFFIPIVYFLLIRKRDIPKITIVPFFIVGIIIASIIIPKDFQTYLTHVKNWVLPIVETTLFFIIIFKVRQLIKEFKKDISHTLDYYSSLKFAASRVLPKKISSAFATEIAVIYYGFFNWKKRKLHSNEYSYHKKSGTTALLSVFIFLILLETSVVHLLLQKWSVVAAWILSVLSLYASIQVFGILKSMRKRPIVIENEELKLRYGLFSESTIPVSLIESIELSSKSIHSKDTTKKLSPLGDFERHNVIIRLNEEVILYGLYGMKSNYTAIALHIDEKEQFETEIKHIIKRD